jgi:hypothetical protein
MLGEKPARVRRGVALLLCFAVASVVCVQSQVTEYDVKAAYLFNFGKFIRFATPDAVIPGQSFDICILGESEFEHTLDRLSANEQLDGKPVHITRLRNAAEAHGCAIVYLSPSEGTRLESDLNSLRGESVLTVSDADSFLKRGGMIQFIRVENHVRFAVNLDAVRNAKLGLSSELLKVAISVNGEPAGKVRP